MQSAQAQEGEGSGVCVICRLCNSPK